MEEVDKPQPPKEHKQRAPQKKGSNFFEKPKNNRVLCIQFCDIKNSEKKRLTKLENLFEFSS
jgi:hypothetical protein